MHVTLVGGLDAKLCLTLTTSWTAACQAPLSTGYPRQKYWSGFAVPFSSGPSRSRDRAWVSCTAGSFFPSSYQGSPGKTATDENSARLCWWLGGEESAHQCRRHKFKPESRKVPDAWRGQARAPRLLSLCPGAGGLQPLSPRTREPEKPRQ